jgi:hypothetical protein
MVYEDISADLPKTFFYNLKKLKGSFSKQIIKITPDRTLASPNDITTFRFPIGSVLNLNSLAMHFKGTTSGTNITIFPKYTSTLIKRLSVAVNNVSVQIINDYNLVYNTYADLNSANLTTRFGEKFDSTTNFVNTTLSAATATASPLVATNLLASAQGAITAERMVINHFLGILGGGSTPIWNTDLMGEIVVSVQWENQGVLCGTSETAATTYTSADTYSLSDIYMSVESFSFTNDEYYQALATADKKIGFHEWSVVRFPKVAKNSGIDITTYISASSLDCVIGTSLPPNAITAIPKTMVGHSSCSAGTGTLAINIYKYLSDPVASTGAGGAVAQVGDVLNYGDGYYSTMNMIRDLQYINTSVFYINNRMINYQPLDPLEIHQQNMFALNYENLDLSNNGFNPSCVSLAHFFKYYGVCMQDLSLLNPATFYLSGLNSAGSSVSINWKATFNSFCTNDAYPVLIIKTSRILNISEGRQIAVV